MLKINDLSVFYKTENGDFQAVRNLSFSLEKGESLGIIGASGSGKTSVALAILGLLENNARTTGCIYFGEKNILQFTENQWLDVRGKRIGLVCQDPMSALNPIMRCGEQVAESFIFHQKMTKDAAKTCVLELFEQVKLAEPERIFESFPHQISGGQKQRVMIAIALAGSPDLLIFDEPTTALDRETKHTFFDLLKNLRKMLGLSLIFISHDLESIAQVADNVLILENGTLKKMGAASEILAENRRIFPKKEQKKVFLSENDVEFLLEINNATLRFPQPRRFLWNKKKEKTVFENLHFFLKKGETVGLVGISGKGKTSLARAIVGLEKLSAGEILFKKRPISTINDRFRVVQLIFQDAVEALNPRLTIDKILDEPLEKINIPKINRRVKILDIFQKLDLDVDILSRFSHQISGGQRQRVNIARALLLEPEILICDEITASLDAAHQLQLLDLLKKTQEKSDFSILLISHDDDLVEAFCDRVVRI
jgi:ABC-type glutathione transport system ATPase component